MHKRRLLVFIAVMFVCITGVFIGCAGSSDAYSGMSIKSSKSTVSLCIEFTGEGAVDGNKGKLSEEISVSVSGAPSAISTVVNVTSLDSSVATAQVLRTSGDKTYIKISAVNSGKTQIKAIAGGGGSGTADTAGKYALINVVVDIPPVAMAVKDGVYFGAMRGGKVELLEKNFDFYASSVKSTGYITTLNDVSYEFASSCKTEALASGCVINGSVLRVGPGYSRSTIELVPTLAYNGITSEKTVIVHIFDDMALNDIVVSNAPVSSKSSMPTVELVKNVTGQDSVNSTIEFKNTSPYYGGIGLKWAYTISRYDDSILYINNAGNTGNFNFVSMGIGETDVSVVVYPVKDVDGKLVHFNNTELQRIKKVRVEIRNAFKTGQLKFIQKVSELNDEVISSIDAFFGLNESDKATLITDFKIGVEEGGILSGIAINNTRERTNNNYVTFSVSGVGVAGQSWNIWDVFNISYKLWPYTGRSVTMQQSDYVTGVPYDAQFSISIKNEVKAAAWSNPKLLVKSIQGNINHEIPVNFVYEISSVRAASEYSGSTGAIVEIDMLSPVTISSGGNGNNQFFLVSKERNSNDSFRFVFEEDAADYFKVTSGGTTSSSVNYASIFTLSIKSGMNPDLNKRYYVNAVHKCGVSVRLGIQVLNRLESNPTLSVTSISGDMVYDAESSGNKFAAFFQIGGTYAVNLRTNPTNALKGYSVPNLSSLSSDGLVISGNLWRPTKEAVYTFTLNLDAYNIDVFTSSAQRTINVELVVVNPVIAVSFNKNHQTVLSSATLGLSPELGLNQAESFADFDLQLSFDGGQSNKGFVGTYQKQTKIDFSFAGMKSYTRIEGGVTKHYAGNGIIELWQDPANPVHIRVQGLSRSAGNIDICFNVYQTYKIGNKEIEIKFLSSLDRYKPSVELDEGSHFFVSVNDADVVENIFVADAGSRLDITLDTNEAKTEIADTDFYLRASVYPYYAHNTRLGFGFLDSGALVQNIGNIISIEKLTGKITAKQSNIESGQEIILVVYALDSLTGDGTFPGTYIQMPVYIYDKTTTKNERVIRSLEEFLEAFFIRPNQTKTFTEFAKSGQLTSRSDLGVTILDTVYNCNYRLAADIDLSPVYESGNYLPMITGFGKSGTAILSGLKPSFTAEAEDCYSILNFKVSPKNVFENNVEYYGMFDILGTGASIVCLNFKNVTGSIVPGDMGVSREHILGTLASVNKGTIKNVCVELSSSSPLSLSIGARTTTTNVGGIVGKNEAGGRIIEDVKGRVNVLGGITVNFGVNNPSLVNFGGIVGLNNGIIEGKNKNDVLSGGELTNCDAILAFTGGEERSFTHSAEFYVSIGGIAGTNAGATSVINGVSSECVIYNSVKQNGNTGGLVGHNNDGAGLKDSFSNSAIYARNAMGGVVGRNTGTASGTNTVIERCYYENYLNKNVQEKLMSLLDAYINKDWWGGAPFYAGLITDARVANELYNNVNHTTTSPTTIGGVVGVNTSGDVKYSFASSMFDNKTERVDYFDLPYKGDISILGTRNAVVGGVIGRQDYASSRTSVIEGCYSTLTIHYDYIGQSPVPEDDTRIGGIIGYINNARASINNCYSNIDLRLNQHATNGLVSFGGFIGAATGGSNSVNFNSCYSRVVSPAVADSSVVTNIEMPNESRVYTASLWPSVSAGVTHAGSLLITAAGWTNTLTAPYAYDAVTKKTGYDYPMLIVDGQPFAIAVPNEIKLQLKSYDWYAANMGNVKNSRGGYNLVVPLSESISETRAAIFFSGGSYTASSKVANRYYIEELFGVQIDPEIAAKRIAYSIEGAGTEAVITGYEINSDGSPRYFIELKKADVSFGLVVSSTRYLNEGGNLVLINKRINFDVVKSLGYQTAIASASGVVGRNSLDKKGNILGGTFDAQTNTRFNLTGQVDTSGWRVKIDAVSQTNTSSTYPYMPTSGYETVTYSYDGIGLVEFELVPAITVADGTQYLCKALSINVSANIYGGAVDAKFEQSLGGSSTIDASTSVTCEGLFVSDIAGTGANGEQKLLSLSFFNIRIDGKNYDLFKYDSQTLNYQTSTIIKSIGGQSVDLIFELKVNKIVTNSPNYVGNYTEYHFSISVSAAIDTDGRLFGNITGDAIVKPVVAFDENFKFSGIVYLSEKSQGAGYAARTVTTTIEMIAQDLQTVEFQHFANTSVVGTGAMMIDEDQQQSMNIYTQNDLKGLFKVYALPYYATINEFTLAVDDTKPSLQKVGYTDDRNNPLPIYEKWGIAFVQMVWNGRQYVNLPEGAGSFDQESGRYRFYQVSSVNDDGVYTWDGVYYIQTMLVESNLQYTWRGIDGKGSGEPLTQRDLDLYATEKVIARHTLRIQSSVFNINASFVTNGSRKVERKITMYAIEKPGLYFEVDGKVVTDTEQAVGTNLNVNVNMVPSDKVKLKGSPYLEVVGDSNNKASVIYDADNKRFSLWMSADIDLSAIVKVKFDYNQTETNGAIAELSGELVIRPVLFKVRGFSIVGIHGNTLRITGYNRHTMRLMVDAVHANASDVTPEQMERIVSGIAEFNQNLNRDQNEWIEWSAVGNKLNTNWNNSTEIYSGSRSSSINFYLGKYIATGEKFILDSVGISQTSMLYIDVYYEYINGIPYMVSGSRNSLTNAYQISTVDKVAEANLVKVYQDNAYVLMYMEKGVDYILMEDIDLSKISGMENGWVPVKFQAKSLDGNNKRIIINSFNLGAQPKEVGLFSSIEKGSLIKNLNISLPNSGATALSLDLSHYNTTDTIKIGLLAGVNNGIITNCAVVNSVQFKTNTDGVVAVDYDKSTFNKIIGKGQQQVVINIQKDSLRVHFGGLVGENAKDTVISNSRVMIDITVGRSAEGESTSEPSVNVKDIIAAGFVAINEGTIVSSFFRDGNILNYSVIGTATGLYNKTAGFVGENKAGGIIKGSYAMGVADELNANSGTVKYGEIRSRNNVAGFVYENAGLVQDCLVNVRITLATVASGFANSNDGGIIRNCFVNNERIGAYIYYAFVNPSAASVGTLDNCYYVSVGRVSSGGAFNGTSVGGSLSDDGGMADFRRIDNFATINLDGNPFSMSLYTSGGKDPATVWQMMANGPVLISANDIAISVRVIEQVKGSSGEQLLSYSPYALGSKKNPILVSNGDEFNNLIYRGSQADIQDARTDGSPDYSKNIYGEHIRLVNYISLASADLVQHSRLSQTYKTIFQGVLDGNGLSISGMSLNATEEVAKGLDSVGLFSAAQDATIKNLTLTLGAITATGATYVGGVAGSAINSNLVDINVVGTAEIVGKSLVGGLAGFVDVGDGALVENIKVNVPVRAALNQQTKVTTQRFDNAVDYLKYGRTNGYGHIGVAGGAIGMVTGSGEVKHIGNYNAATVGVAGEVVGGLIGAVDYDIKVIGIRYVTTATALNTSALSGKFYVGGLVGINLGEVVDGKIVLPVMNLQSAADSVTSGMATAPSYFIFQSDRSYYGMTVGGAVGFNSGIVDGVVAQVGLNSSNFAYVLVSGGVVGENLDGTVTNCTVGGTVSTGGTTTAVTSINGGYYIGGIVGKNYGDGTTIITNNTINYSTWGANFSGSLSTSSGSVFVGTSPNEYKIGEKLVFFINTTGSSYRTARTEFTGAYVGVNYDTSVVFNGSTVTGMTRKSGSYASPLA